MLDQKTIDIIKSTVPVLETNGNEITTRFYQLLFQNHPELLNIFNHANQKQGRQQTALANAVYAAAAHIDNLGEIISVVKEIGNKHRSLGIKPEHYPIVGENLIAAIKDVLGDEATPEVIDAWKAAYREIANAFIDVEKELYKEAKAQPGGWDGLRNFKVAKKVKESDMITSFYLKPEDGGPISTYLPGQYLGLHMDIPGEKYKHIRQYSLSDAPGKDYYRISVKSEPGFPDKNIPRGVVSNYLHEKVQEGDVLKVVAPAGVFTLDMTVDTPVVLLSGGVGLTPMMSMLNTLVEKQPNRQVTFIHAAQNGNVHAMAGHVVDLAKKHKQLRSYVVYERPTREDHILGFDKEGYITLDWLKEVIPSTDAVFYFCGPLPFMKAIYRALHAMDVPEERIHFEFFGPASELAEEAVLAAEK